MKMRTLTANALRNCFTARRIARRSWVRVSKADAARIDDLLLSGKCMHSAHA